MFHTDTMKDILRGIILLIGCLLKCQAYTVINAVVHEPVTLPCTVSCSGEVQWNIFIPTKANIARCANKTCSVQNDFQKRFAVPEEITRGDFSLLIRSVVYNDAGSYMCTCNGEQQTDIKLKVFVPMAVRANEMKDVILPCYGDTRREARDVQWWKDGQTVLKYNLKTNTVVTSTGFEDRFAVLTEAAADGELSLHIKSVQRSDAGLYLCKIHDESREGDPRAVLLKVEVPIVVGANEMKDVTLPCYGDTQRNTRDVQWWKDGQTVLKYNLKTNTVVTSPGFKDRFAVLTDAAADGELSLHIKSVQRSDAGLYLCKIHDESREGRAVLLKVEEGQRPWYDRVIIIMAAVMVSFGVLGIIFLCTEGRSKTPAETASDNLSNNSLLSCDSSNSCRKVLVTV